VIALDTNVLVRLLIEDDEDQLAKARRVLEPHWEAGGKALLTDVVLAELEWVLESVYDANKAQILTSFHSLASDSRFELQDRPRLLEALRLYQAGRADLSDHLIGLVGSGAGADTTLTFDRALRGDPAFHVL
jgi:predicted nucleic-acid-binding protein